MYNFLSIWVGNVILRVHWKRVSVRVPPVHSGSVALALNQRRRLAVADVHLSFAVNYELDRDNEV